MEEKEVIGVIYKITNTINGKVYIGQTTQDLDERMRQHRKCKLTAIGLAIEKYDWVNFTAEVIDECKTIDELNEREKFWIAEFNSMAPNGYNLTEGGNNAPLTEESRLKISLAQKGIPDRPSTYEERAQRSEIAKKRCADPKVRANMSRIQRDKHGRKVMCVETGKEFPSIRDAADYYGISDKSIGDVCNGRRKRAGGYHWKFIDEDEKTKTVKAPKTLKKVLCVETGEVFNSQAEISRRYGINTGSICRVCNGQLLTLMGYHWKFIDDETIANTEGLKISTEPVKLYINHSNKRRVQCIETGEIFDSIADAAKKYDCCASSIGKVCVGYLKTTGGYRWKYIDEETDNCKIDDEVRKKMRVNQPNTKKVICIETGEIFNSINEAAKKYNCYSSQISRACNGVLNQTHGLHWKFIDEESSSEK